MIDTHASTRLAQYVARGTVSIEAAAHFDHNTRATSAMRPLPYATASEVAANMGIEQTTSNFCYMDGRIRSHRKKRKNDTNDK